MSAWPRCFVLSVTVVGLAVYATPAEGDPIVITGGSVGQFNGEDRPGFLFTGTDSSFQGIVPLSGSLCCMFNVGESVTLSRPLPIGTRIGEPTPEMVNGIQYQTVWVAGSVSFTATPFVAPPLDGTAAFFLTTPFTMQGQIAGWADSNFTGPPLFSVPLTGSGTAVVLGSTHEGQPNYIGQGVGFNFEAPAPTPEPASLALFGAGVVGVCLRRFWRRKERTS